MAPARQLARRLVLAVVLVAPAVMAATLSTPLAALAVMQGVERLLLGGGEGGVEALHSLDVLGHALFVVGVHGLHALQPLRRGQARHLLAVALALSAVFAALL